MKLKLFIPSRGRWEKQSTLDNLPPEIRKITTLVVDAKELKHYHPVAKKYGVFLIPLSVNGITEVRREIIKISEGKIVMLDDDLKFAKRISKTDWHLTPIRGKEVIPMFEWLEKSLGEYAHASISARQGNNNEKADVAYNQRYIRILGFNTKCFEDVKLGRVTVMEDFDIALQLINQGYSSIISYVYAQDQSASNMEGGCSTYRTPQVQADSARKLAKLHPGVVKLVEKETKTGWFKGQPRVDVTIYWKKAWENRQ